MNIKKTAWVFIGMVLTGFAYAATQLEVAKVITTRGKCIASQNGEQRVLRRGSKIYQKDTITTDKRGSMKMRFSDATFLILTPNAQLDINEYQFNKKDPTKNKGNLALVKGGLKSITGLINKNNAAALNYRCGNVATIGIRGTNLEADASKKSCGVYVKSGEVRVTAKKQKPKKGDGGNNEGVTYSVVIKGTDKQPAAEFTNDGMTRYTAAKYKAMIQPEVRGGCR